MDTLTAEQRDRLNALLQTLQALPPPELIAESGRLRCPLPLDDQSKKRMRLSIAGANAAQKCLYYLEWLRAINDERVSIGKEIAAALQQMKVLDESQVTLFARLSVWSTHLSGRQEVSFHLFATWVSQIARLLPFAIRAAGATLAASDQRVLSPYTKLRDYFEHLDERLPGKGRDRVAVNELHTDDEWRIEMTIPRDSAGRFVLDGESTEVSRNAVRVIEDILQRAWERLTIDSIELVRKHFLQHPAEIPDSSSIRLDLLASIDRR